MDAISQQRLSGVAPELRRRATLMLEELEADGIPVRVTCGLRTMMEQQTDWEQGRSRPGRIITQARPGYSDHQFGMAIDVVPMTLPHGQPDWNDTHPVWATIVATGEKYGLIAGARFLHNPDEPHFQLTGTFPVTPTDDERSLLMRFGMLAVWKTAGLIEPPTVVDVNLVDNTKGESNNVNSAENS